jgi:hypothetical protein
MVAKRDKRKSFRIRSDLETYLQSIAKLRNCSENDAINWIIQQHENGNKFKDLVNLEKDKNNVLERQIAALRFTLRKVRDALNM